MESLIKYAVRQVLNYLKQATDATQTEVDDQAFIALRQWALAKGWIDDGGQDDPGPAMRGGGNGGP